MTERNKTKQTAKAIFDLIESFDTLEALPRTGYLLRGVRPCENIASHCFSTVVLAMMLADAQGDVDTEKVLRMAALHESSEALTGDIPRPARSFFPSGATETIELSAGQSLFEKMPDPDRYKRLLSEYIDCKSPEAQLVRAADKLQMLCKVRFYQKAGATNLHDFFENDQGMDLAPFPVAQALFDLLSKIGSSTKHDSEA